MNGIVAFFTAKDIPGENNFITPAVSYGLDKDLEEILCSRTTKYAGQPIGVIVGRTQELAIKAKDYVKVYYSSTGRNPVMTIQEVLDSGDQSRIFLMDNIEPTTTKTDIKHIIKGKCETHSQYHYSMELQTCRCEPTDYGMRVFSSTQWISNVQDAVSKALNIPMSRVLVIVNRLGGAFGCKITRASMIAAICAIAAYNLRQTVSMVLDLVTNTKAIGKRSPSFTNYEVGVNNDGVVQYLHMDYYENKGAYLNDLGILLVIKTLVNFYDISTWKANLYAVKTDLQTSIWMRAPGTLEASTTIEYVMDHIAYTVKRDPLEVRKLNMNPADRPVLYEMIDTIIKSSNFVARNEAVQKYNQENRWKKKEIMIQPIRYLLKFLSNYYSLVSIYASDGSVSVTIGGIEMGQGIYTKLAQIAAYALGVDLDTVNVLPSVPFVSPNTFASGGSITTSAFGYATLKACEMLMSRLNPLREQLDNPTWIELVQYALQMGVELSAQYKYSLEDDPGLQDYPVYCVAVLETEVDLLTGEHQVLRTDILEDAGQSLNPLLDIGQVEGAFVMGLGYFHSENIIYDSNGVLLTNRTWNYWPPGAKDIPVDFRVTLRKNSKNPIGVLGSKATSEPPICLTVVLLRALRAVLRAVRKDNGQPDEWFDFYPPCTHEKVLLTANIGPEQYQLYRT